MRWSIVRHVVEKCHGSTNAGYRIKSVAVNNQPSSGLLVRIDIEDACNGTGRLHTQGKMIIELEEESPNIFSFHPPLLTVRNSTQILKCLRSRTNLLPF